MRVSSRLAPRLQEAIAARLDPPAARAGGGGGGARSGGAGAEAGGGLWASLGVALLKLGVRIAIVAFAGGRLIPRLLVRVAKLRSRELFTLTVLVFSIAIAAGADPFFGASMALGAFLAGMVVAQSR